MVNSSSRLQRAALYCSIVLLSLSSGLSAQSTKLDVATVAWSSASDYTAISSIRRLADARSIIVDAATREVFLLSAKGTVLARVGRDGDGPGEYRQPRAALFWPGDSTLVLDVALRRFSVFGPSGTFARSFTFPPILGTAPDSDTKVDKNGRLYFRSADLSEVNRYSDVLIRWDPRTGAMDTLSRLLGPRLVKLPPPTRQSGRPFEVRMVPFSPVDAWTLRQSGQVVVVRAQPFSIETVSTTNLRTRIQLDYTPIRVSAAEQRAVTPLLRDSMPKTKPAFVASDLSVSEAGEVFIRLNSMWEAKMAQWLLIDVSGRVTRFSLPADAKIKWADSQLIILTRKDEDGLQRIEARYRR